jgi:hypothetical protein
MPNKAHQEGIYMAMCIACPGNLFSASCTMLKIPHNYIAFLQELALTVTAVLVLSLPLPIFVSLNLPEELLSHTNP